MVDTQEKIRGFSLLPTDWHYGSGQPASQTAVAIALLFESFIKLAGFPDTDAFPGIDGELMVAGYNGTNHVQVTIEPDETFRVAHELDGSEVFYKEGLSADDAVRHLSKASSRANRQIWVSSASSIPNIMTAEKVGLSTSLSDHSQTLPERPVYHALNRTVQFSPADQSATISQNFTGNLPIVRRSSGSSVNQTFHMEAA